MHIKMRQGDRIVFTAILVVMVGSLLGYWLAGRAAGDVTAVIKLNGDEIRRINLSTVKQPMEFTIYSGVKGDQYDIVEVEEGRIRVREANCPEQIIVIQGWISRPGQSAICLPHRLVIQILSSQKSDIDAIST